jgi:hypothetical protein
MKAQLLTTQISQTKEYPMRIVSVVFGNPRSEECAGYGLCRLDEDWPPPMPTKPTKPTKETALISCSQRVSVEVTRAETTDGQVGLAFNFLKKELNPEATKKYFGDIQFTVGSDLALPVSLKTAFDLDASRLKAGLYVIEDKTTSFRIVISLK